MDLLSFDRPFGRIEEEVLPENILFLDGGFKRHKTGLVSPHLEVHTIMNGVLRMVQPFVSELESRDNVYFAKDTGVFLSKPGLPISCVGFESMLPEFLLIDHRVPFMKISILNNSFLEDLNFFYIPTDIFLSWSIQNFNNISFEMIFRILESIASKEDRFVFDVFLNNSSKIEVDHPFTQCFFRSTFSKPDFSSQNGLFLSTLKDAVKCYRDSRFGRFFEGNYEVCVHNLTYADDARFNYCLMDL